MCTEECNYIHAHVSKVCHMLMWMPNLRIIYGIHLSYMENMYSTLAKQGETDLTNLYMTYNTYTQG